MEQLIRNQLSKAILQRKDYASTWLDVGKQQDGIRQFMTLTKWNEEVREFVLQETSSLGLFKSILMALEDEQQESLAMRVNDYLQKIKEKDADHRGIQKQNLIEEPQPYEQITGDKLRIQIIFNPARMNLDYLCQNINLKDYFRPFILNMIKELKVRVEGEKQSIRILDERVVKINKYTPIYIFDPFMGSVRFILKKKIEGGSFNKSFKVIQPEDLQLDYIPDSSQQFWKDCHFSVADSVKNLINNVAQEQTVEPAFVGEIMEFIDRNEIKTIKEMLNCPSFKQLIERMPQERWMKLFLIKIESVNRRKIQSSFQRYLYSQKILECLRQGNSHKILRYLFFKSIRGKQKFQLETLNRTLPLLNERIVNEAICLLQRELIMPQVLNQLHQNLKIYTTIQSDSQQKIYRPYGILFHGPSGAGKTKLSEELSQLFGFHLVQNEISSVYFMKQFVGEAKGCLESILSRSLLSPHLACILGIDDIELLFPSRKEYNKELVEIFSHFLSIMGGNMAMQNILILSSTNKINDVDYAFLKNNISIYVGFPSKELRKQIILNYLTFCERFIDFLVQITPNFSRAALICLIQQIYKAKEGNTELTQSDFITLANSTAKKFDIKFRSSTYQSMLQNILVDQKICLSFLKATKNQAIVLKAMKDKVYLLYGIEDQYFDGKQIKSRYQYCKNVVSIKKTSLKPNIIRQWLGNNFKAIVMQKFDEQKLLERIEEESQKCNKENQVFFINFDWATQLSFMERLKSYKGLFFCFYSQNQCLEMHQLQNSVKRFFGLKDIRFQYSGRMFVDLSRTYPSCMELETKEFESILEIRPFIREKKIKNSTQALPQVINFFVQKGLNFIQVVGRDFFVQKSAQSQQECIVVIQNLRKEMTFYKKGGLIFELDSLKLMSRKFSALQERQVNESAFFNEILWIIKQFSFLKDDEEKWICVIVEEDELSKDMKQQMRWPPKGRDLCKEFKQSEKIGKISISGSKMVVE